MSSDLFDFSKKIAVMGILNVTPDSFSDGGKFLGPDQALDHALQMQEEGADFLDIGAESTRPGAPSLNLQEELLRLRPVLDQLSTRVKIPLSLDTRKASVAQMAVERGVSLINDISGFLFDPEMIPFLQKNKVGAVLMHSRGTPETMAGLTRYDSVVEDLLSYFEQRLEGLQNLGIGHDRLWIDPGIGFAKTPQQNMEILSQLSRFKKWGRPLLVGLSRKSFLDIYFGPSTPSERRGSTEIAHTLAIFNGANILRVHDVAAARKTIEFVQEAKGTL